MGAVLTSFLWDVITKWKKRTGRANGYIRGNWTYKKRLRKHRK